MLNAGNELEPAEDVQSTIAALRSSLPNVIAQSCQAAKLKAELLNFGGGFLIFSILAIRFSAFASHSWWNHAIFLALAILLGLLMYKQTKNSLPMAYEAIAGTWSHAYRKMLGTLRHTSLTEAILKDDLWETLLQTKEQNQGALHLVVLPKTFKQRLEYCAAYYDSIQQVLEFGEEFDRSKLLGETSVLFGGRKFESLGFAPALAYNARLEALYDYFQSPDPAALVAPGWLDFLKLKLGATGRRNPGILDAAEPDSAAQTETSLMEDDNADRRTI